MVKAKIKIKNASGLHLRPTGLLCNEAMKYQASVKFQFGNSLTNAKSVLSVLGACVKSGDEIEFVCEGPDETAALAAIIELVESGLGE